MNKMILLTSKLVLIGSIASTNVLAANAETMNANNYSKNEMTSQSYQNDNYDALDIYAEDYSLILQTEESQTTSATSKPADYSMSDVSEIYDEDYSPLL